MPWHEGGIAYVCNSSTGEVKAKEPRVQGHSKFKASMGCMNSALPLPTYTKSGMGFSINR